jgi:thioredoxin-dependent peroxiredoxin
MMFVMMRNLVAVLMLISAGVARAADESEVVTKAAVPEVGQPLPALESTDEAGQLWKSADHIGKKVLVLYLYPGDFTGGCTKQAQTYRDALAKIEELGVEVVGVSGDEVATHKLFKETYGLKHSLLADSEGRLAKLLGVPVKAGGKVRATGPDRKPLLDADGKRIDLERSVTLARWTVVVDRDGKIASLRSSVNPATDAEEIQKIVDELRR